MTMTLSSTVPMDDVSSTATVPSRVPNGHVSTATTVAPPVPSPRSVPRSSSIGDRVPTAGELFIHGSPQCMACGGTGRAGLDPCGHTLGATAEIAIQVDEGAGWRTILESAHPIGDNDQPGIDVLVEELAEAAVRASRRVRVSATTVDREGRALIAYCEVSPTPKGRYGDLKTHERHYG